MKSLIISRAENGEIQETLSAMSEAEVLAYTSQKAERDNPIKNYAKLRNMERGTIAQQLEFIVENGIEQFIQRDLEIRAKYPK